MIERHLTSRELGQLLGFSAAWVQDQFEAGRLPGFRIGGRLRFRESEVLDWLEAHRGPVSSVPMDSTPCEPFARVL
jgi:excisionase family DNA binding protein